MDFTKFYRQGWGLHRDTIEKLYNIINNNNIQHVVEFGSGGSTEFFIESRIELNKNYTIDSFDHNQDFSYNGPKFDFLNLMVRDLIVCNDDDYNEMFKNQKISNSLFEKTNDILNTRIKNATYLLNDDDLNKSYDLILIDGPNGNGRNLNFLHLKNKIKSGAHIIIDDYFHYDFVERCLNVFNCEVLEEVKFTYDHPNKGHAILKLK